MLPHIPPLLVLSETSGVNISHDPTFSWVGPGELNGELIWPNLHVRHLSLTLK